MSPQPTHKPTLILHGGAGAIRRTTLPPTLYAKYHASLLTYLRSTTGLLESGATALDAAVHAVSLMEDDELFNCGRGSVFTSAGEIEMEASVMVTSATKDDDALSGGGMMKRGAGVMGVRNVRYPVRLAREVLLRAGQDGDGNRNPVGRGHGGDGGSMHCQLSGPYVEELARGWGLEFKPDEWFWTRRRWEEHRRGLDAKSEAEPGSGSGQGSGQEPEPAVYLSQGTVGCVCLDRWGDLAVATSTGGLTNKLPGRVGDTPTLGAGFWAEAWEVEDEGEGGLPLENKDMRVRQTGSSSRSADGNSVWDLTLADCLPGPARFFRGMFTGETPPPRSHSHSHQPPQYEYDIKQPLIDKDVRRPRKKRRAVAVSGTGNGDSFLRTAAARTTCAMMRFSPRIPHLTDAVTAIAGPGGEMQRSAGRRWGKTGEGIGGIIGIEAEAEVEIDDDGTMRSTAVPDLRRGNVVFDFNCGGMFRAWIEEDADGRDVERVMVFREEYS